MRVAISPLLAARIFLKCPVSLLLLLLLLLLVEKKRGEERLAVWAAKVVVEKWEGRKRFPWRVLERAQRSIDIIEGKTWRGSEERGGFGKIAENEETKSLTTHYCPSTYSDHGTKPISRAAQAHRYCECVGLQPLRKLWLLGGEG